MVSASVAALLTALLLMSLNATSPAMATRIRSVVATTLYPFTRILPSPRNPTKLKLVTTSLKAAIPMILSRVVRSHTPLISQPRHLLPKSVSLVARMLASPLLERSMDANVGVELFWPTTLQRLRMPSAIFLARATSLRTVVVEVA